MKKWNWICALLATWAASGVVPQLAEAGVKRAVIVGINESSPQSKLPKLHFAAADAERMREVLILAGYDPRHIRVLVTTASDPLDQPSRTNIVAALRELTNPADGEPTDSVMFVYAGHGFNEHRESFLCPTDFDSQAPQKSALQVSELATLLADSPAPEKFVVLDACRNEAIAEDNREFNLLTGLKTMRLNSDKGQGVVFFSSCLAGEQSVEEKTLGHGVFLHYFAQALEGYADYVVGNHDGKVTASEAIDYAARRCSGFVQQRYDIRQTPWSDSHSTAELVISVPPADTWERVKEACLQQGTTGDLNKRIDSLLPISRKNAESKLDAAIGSLVSGDRNATVRLASEAIEYDEKFYLARRIRSVMYQIQGNQSGTKAAEFYEKAIEDMRVVGSRLRISLAGPQQLKNGNSQPVPMNMGDVVLVEGLELFQNQYWLKITGVQRKGVEGGAGIALEERVGFIPLAAVANPQSTEAQIRDLNRAQKPTRSDVVAQQQQAQLNPVRPAQPMGDGSRLAGAQNALNATTTILAPIPYANRATQYTGMASGYIGMVRGFLGR
jgi:uncharacterized caspase-like protein